MGDLEGSSEAAIMMQLTYHVAYLLAYLAGARLWLGLQLLHISMYSPSASLISGPAVYVFSSMTGLCRTPRISRSRQQVVTWVDGHQSILIGSTMFLFSPTLHPSFLLNLLPCGLQASASTERQLLYKDGLTSSHNFVVRSLKQISL